MATDLRHYTLAQVAAIVSTSVDRIGDRVRAGDLRAIDIRSPGARRATWRISADELERWLASRSTQPAAPKARRRKRAAYKSTYY